LFLNIVYADRVARPVTNDSEQHRPGGSSWSVPYALGPLRTERDKSGMNLVPAFDCCFHPLTLRYAHARRGFLDLVIDIVKDAVSKAFGASGDEVEILDGYTILRGVSYKSGTPRALMIGIDTHEDATVSEMNLAQTIEPRDRSLVEITRSGVHNAGVRVPKYKIVERRAFDIAEHTTTTTASDVPTTQRPSHLIVTIYLDRATTKTSAAADINLDVRERELKITPDSKCGYRLEVALPYRVDPKRGDARFDRERITLIVTLPVV
jgi:dynein assembly factor 2